MRDWEYGFILHSREQDYKSKMCRVDNPMETEKRALTLNDLSSAFIILVVGLSITTFCFVIEILSKVCFDLVH